MRIILPTKGLSRHPGAVQAAGEQPGGVGVAQVVDADVEVDA